METAKTELDNFTEIATVCLQLSLVSALVFQAHSSHLSRPVSHPETADEIERTH